MQSFHNTEINMKRVLILTSLAIIASAMFAPHRLSAQSRIDQTVESLKRQMTVEEKIDLLCADAPGISRLNMPRYDWWSECLHGVARAGKATVFPKPIGMGSTWDTELIRRIGAAISDEARAKHHRAMQQKGYSERHFGLTFFSPTINIARDPRWGRTSECFSEDPLITGDMGAAFIQGLQGDDPVYLKLVATPKHFVANNEEDRRLNGSADVDEISLREYYFPAFREAVTKGKATSVMGAYNALNGVPCCANHFLLTEVLRDEWGFKGVVISDGSAIDKLYTHHKYVSSLEEGAALALKAGCDMSLRDEYRKGLRLAYQKQLISDDDIDRAVSRVLNLRVRLGIDGSPGDNPYTQIPYSVVESAEHRRLALEAAEKSIILLKNDNILPLRINGGQKLKIGLIGEAFKTVYYGDYSGTPENNPTLLECITGDAGQNAEITWISEQTSEEIIPAKYLARSADQAYDGILGFTGIYYDNAQMTGQPRLVRQDLSLDFIPSKDDALRAFARLSAKWEADLAPPTTGRYSFALAGTGQMKMFINDSLVASRTSNTATKIRFDCPMSKEKKYRVRIESNNINPEAPIALTWRPPYDDTGESPERIARRSDVAILFLRDDNSSEGRDRKSLRMSDAQIELIDRITRSNPNTILILGSGTTLALADIVGKPRALLNVWIAGQEEAPAISRILLGKVNPSGKTAVTFFANESQLPPIDDYNVKHGRSYQYFNGDVLFPFGFGLSYTTFAYSAPSISKTAYSGGEDIQVTVSVTNSGQYDGEEVVQCYLSSPNWEKDGLNQKLAGFQRVFLKKGETKEVRFALSKEDLLRWDINKKDWNIVTDSYEISVAPHSGLKNATSFKYYYQR